MAQFNEVVITFTNDWIVGDKIVGQMSEVPSSLIWTWVTTRSGGNEVTAGTPTANAGETSAINFAAAFLLDYPTGYIVNVVSTNKVSIKSTTVDEIFQLWGVFSGSGTLAVQLNFSEIDAKINIRSPYFVTATETGLTKCLVDLYIFTGDQIITIPTPTYSLEIDAYNDIVSFDISQLVSDYLETSFDGTFNSNVVWVNYQITRYVSDVVQTSEDIVRLVAFDGYGYFEEGVNPALSDRLLQSNSTMYVYDANYFYFPIQQDDLSQIDLISGGSIVDTQTFTPTIDSEDVIRYVGYTNSSICDTVNYLFEDSDNYLFQDANEYVFSDVGYVDSILITYDDATTQTITIKTITENKYTPYRLTFINKFGALQSVWMFKRSDLSLSVESENYRGYLYNSGSYNTAEHQYKNFNITGREVISLNSGFYNEDYNEIFRQLVLSGQVWIDYEGNLLPVNIKSKELSFKTQVNDKLINYKIDFDFAFDKINSVY